MGYTAFDQFLARRRFRMALPHIRKDSRVCDIGSGLETAFLREAASRIRFGVGIDHAMPLRKPDDFAFVRADVSLGLPVRDNEFHHVVMLAVLEHLSHPVTVLEEAFRVLLPGGSLIVTWPAAVVDPLLKVLDWTRLISPEMESHQHQPRIPKPALLDLLSHAGFERCSHRRFELGLNNFLVAYKPVTCSTAAVEELSRKARRMA